ncbi:3249_t:CDS:2 [Funneliformis mosseae]|uniref:3249_t:CDS:1 n=1 Tax=Funneliformis mosseae TaxID=27381 RepID=A0A9N8Z319_FUNMO|nr:3249_t:CDS:2 [Funneliformis mosseae]
MSDHKQRCNCVKSKKDLNHPYPSLSTSPFGVCSDCNSPNTDKPQYNKYGWCHSCNSTRFEKELSSWTSNNPEIDNLIKGSQLNAMKSRQVLEWIPYEKLYNVQFVAKGGFDCIVYSATWVEGNILFWDSKKQNWVRRAPVPVALKRFENSHNITADFFEEVNLS